jgi:hypothetical protein
MIEVRKNQRQLMALSNKLDNSTIWFYITKWVSNALGKHDQ